MLIGTCIIGGVICGISVARKDAVFFAIGAVIVAASILLQALEVL